MTTLAWVFFWTSVTLGFAAAAFHPSVDAGRLGLAGLICFSVAVILAAMYADDE